jgi:hypothetical protein
MILSGPQGELEETHFLDDEARGDEQIHFEDKVGSLDDFLDLKIFFEDDDHREVKM